MPALLPSFIGDFTQRETGMALFISITIPEAFLSSLVVSVCASVAGRALSLHLVAHLHDLEQPEVDLVPKPYHDKVGPT